MAKATEKKAADKAPRRWREARRALKPIKLNLHVRGFEKYPDVEISTGTTLSASLDNSSS